MCLRLRTSRWTRNEKAKPEPKAGLYSSEARPTHTALLPSVRSHAPWLPQPPNVEQMGAVGRGAFQVHCDTLIVFQTTWRAAYPKARSDCRALVCLGICSKPLLLRKLVTGIAHPSVGMDCFHDCQGGPKLHSVKFVT